MYKMKNGKRVPLTSKELDEFNKRKDEHKGYVKSYEGKLEVVQLKRSKKYPPITDQLDAILKQLNYMQMKGETDLIKPLDAIVAEWLKVKRDYPKLARYQFSGLGG